MFVGREREMAELEKLLDEALGGKERLAMLVGEPGIGKTRTARELSDTAAERGARVLWGRSQEAVVGPPYWLWVQVLRSYVDAGDSGPLREDMGAGAAYIAEIVPELRERLPDVPVARPLEDPDQARFRLFDAVTRFFRNAVRRRPIVLVLDNLQWASKPSLLLLEFLAQELEGAPLLVVGTYRDEELSRKHPLSDTLAVLHRERHLVRVLLRGLTLSEVAEFTRSMTAREPSPQLVEAIHRQTEGNPFFVTEVVRYLAERGELSDASAVRTRIPEGVRDAIGQRLNRLSEASNEVLRIASVIGREFRVEELQPLVDAEPLDDDGLIDTLEECLTHGMLEVSPEGLGRYQFKHALVRDTLYEELSPPRRARLHGRIGELLEKLYQENLDPHLARLAHHFYAAAPAGGHDKVIDYATRAGDRALKLLAYEEASDFFRMALEIMELRDDEDSVERCRLFFQLGLAHDKAGEVQRAMVSFDASASMAIRLGLSEELARAALAREDLSRRFHVGIGDTIEKLEKALAALPAEDSALRANLIGAAARAFCLVGDYERYHTLGRDAVEMARRLDDRSALMSALRVRIYARLDPAEIQERLDAIAELTELARELGELEHEIEAHGHRAMELYELGEIRLADEAVAEHGRVSEIMRQPFYEHSGSSFYSMRATMAGDFELAENLIRQTFSLGQRLGRGSGAGVYGIQMFTLRRLQGRLEEVAPALKGFIAGNGVDSSWKPGLAALYAELGMLEEAGEILDELAEDDFAGLPRDSMWLVSIAYLAEVVARLRDAPRAEILYQMALPYSGLNIGAQVACYGAASRYLGLLAGTLTRWDAAEEHFARGLELNRAMNARPWAALTEHDWAAMLLERQRPGDDERARSLLESARTTALELGMRQLVERASSKLDSRCERAVLAGSAPDQLTPREIDVLRLLASGRSNREISEALFISLHTVATHVRHILAKSGSANRTEAAAYAYRHGLT